MCSLILSSCKPVLLDGMVWVSVWGGVCVKDYVSLGIKRLGELVQIYCLCQLCQIWQAQMVSLQMAGVKLRVNKPCNN